MKTVQIIREQDNKLITKNCLVAQSLGARLKGLLGKSTMASDEVLWLKPCNSIHSFFMAFAIDVVFLDYQNKIVAIKLNFKPNRMHWPILRAHSTLEFLAGTGLASQLQLGDILNFQEVSHV